MQSERVEEAGGDARTLTPAPPPAPRRGRVAATTSVERGRGPPPGVYFPPFFWSNVVDAPPPRRAKRGRGTYVLYQGMDVGSETRISYSTVVTVDPTRDESVTPTVDAPLPPRPFDPNDHTIRVDSRVSVQRRLFLEFMSKEADVMDRFTSRWRQGMLRNLVTQRRVALALPYRWMRRGALAGIRAQGRAGLWTIGAVRRSSRSLVHFPDRVLTWALLVWSHLGDRIGRKALSQGMKDPRTLTNEQKSVVLLLSSTIVLGTIFLLNNLMLLVPKFGASADAQGAILAGYSQLVSTFLWGVATAVLLPFPPSELLALNAYYEAGPLLAFAAITASKVVGAWLVFFIGDALNDSIREQTDGRPRLARTVDWMKVNSEKYGLWILAFFTAMPFLPDTLALYVFAVSGMRFRSFILGAAIGTGVRYAGILGVAHFLGRDALAAIPGL